MLQYVAGVYLLMWLLSLQDGVSFEVRRYDGAKYAVVSSEGRTFDQVTGELVRKLLMYIGGSNEQGKPLRYGKNYSKQSAKICFLI